LHTPNPWVICSNFFSLSVIECYYYYPIYTTNDFHWPNLYIWIKVYCIIIYWLRHCLLLKCISIWQGYVYRIHNQSLFTFKRHRLELYFRWHVSPHLLRRPLKGDLVILNSMPFPKRDLFKCGAYPVTTVISRYQKVVIEALICIFFNVGDLGRVFFGHLLEISHINTSFWL